ncbi:MAG: hypothetical protein JNM03_09305 [Sphingopyxis sp.]|uniref:STM3941 family protein n=1 Tax=Sphingopyxis sp. TaxID=1908224 RepID=UPI001A59BB71|nr:STM3941 family protein [Sphingopyxis sp.]MBL9070175.1 hypothetical protein [Sphingopyxis sp.]
MTGRAFVARYSLWRMALLALAAVGFVFAGLLLAGTFGPPLRPGAEWIGWIGVVFFGACLLVIVRRMFDAAEIIRISGNGIYFKSWSDQTVPWSEITDVTIWEYQRQKTIILHLRRPDRFPSTKLLGKVSAANRALTGGDIPISLTGTDGKFADAMAAIAYYRRAT